LNVEQMTEGDRVLQPSQAVMVDVGPGHGALVISAPATMLGDEIEISPATDPDARQHVFVLRRTLPRKTAYAAAFPRLRAGSYLVWGTGDRVVATPTVREGEVAAITWPPDEITARTSGPVGSRPVKTANPRPQGV